MLAKLPAEGRPAVILTTAHDRFALDAFAAQVVDYLLKPFDRERFETALRRAIRHARAQREENFAVRIEGILAAPAARRPAKLLVKADGRTLFIACDEIVWVEAESNYSVLHLQSAKRLILRETLTSLEKRIGASTIARVNRSALVHVNQVQELLASKYGDYQVVLRNGVRLPLSRTLRSRFEKLVTSESDGAGI
jgi:two-component system LytT family response regulator